YEEDIWTEISKYLGGRCIVNLGLVNRWFHQSVLQQQTVWKYACLRDLQMPQPLHHVPFKWSQLYASTFDGSHSYEFRQQEKHIDWMRIGAFFFHSSLALLTDKLKLPVEIPKGETVEKMLETTGSCLLNNVKRGIWIADLQLVRCPVCNLDTCEGTMQTLDTRHLELFLNQGFKDGSWEYQEIGTHEIMKHSDGATGGIFDIKHLNDPGSKEMLNLKSWASKPCDWQPKALIDRHAVAVSTNLQQNDGKYLLYIILRLV
ncbi:hypothetical protein GIB67_008300, partial [Kingdonia uniflora]